MKKNFADFLHFSETLKRAGISPKVVESAWEDLFVRYCEPHRHYHNLRHIDRMLAWLASTGIEDVELSLAIWYHDVIYNPQASDNEQMSARFFLSALGEHLPPRLCSDVSRLILATDPRSERTNHRDENLLIDVDLGILGASASDYRDYCVAIRQEYAFVSDADFAEGRSRVLKAFLKKPIYQTEFFRHLELPARENIARELQNLNAA